MLRGSLRTSGVLAIGGAERVSGALRGVTIGLFNSSGGLLCRSLERSRPEARALSSWRPPDPEGKRCQVPRSAVEVEGIFPFGCSAGLSGWGAGRSPPEGNFLKPRSSPPPLPEVPGVLRSAGVTLRLSVGEDGCRLGRAPLSSVSTFVFAPEDGPNFLKPPRSLLSVCAPASPALGVSRAPVWS